MDGGAAAAADGQVSDGPPQPAVVTAEPQPHQISSAAASHLAAGFVASIVPPLDVLEKQLLETRDSQQAIITALEEQENALKEDQRFQEVIETMSLLSLYHNKLLTIRKDMVQIAEKTSKMKKRLQKLESKKVKMATKHAKEQEEARLQEERLRARPVGWAESEGRAEGEW
mmetsp:Transcript_4101/g.10348  ORF Transcript_4101/g.10348 Transcript_4101/m.10348 type:complete len:171 (-) Transcript_4101:98-610(-)